MRTLEFFNRAVITAILIISINFSYASNKPVRAKNGMVVSENALASKVGLEILKKGGNAIDAAVATGFALAVTYPIAGNIGGGGFMVIHLKDGENISIDFREKAPSAASRNMFLDKNGNFNSKLSLKSGKSVGVPGTVYGLLFALEHYGTMQLSEVIQPAINYAENGFILDYETAESFNSYFDDFSNIESSKKIFTNNGRKFNEGDLFVQKDLAKTLKLIRDNGIDGFYSGSVAELIVKQVNAFDGIITKKDLKNYKAKLREPVISSYRGFKIVSMPPPSSGGIVLSEMLNILENFDIKEEQWGSSGYIHKLVSAMKFGYADRARYLGDPDFVLIPQEGLISKKYALDRFNLISDSAISSSKVFPGKPFLFQESDQTTHYSIYDSFGNAVSTTTTLNSSYGNKTVVDGAGFLLNNEMDDFSAKPGVPNQFGLIGYEANSILPEKRMLSSMTPTIVLKDNQPFLILGSPGGSTIITAVMQVIENVIDFHMNIQEAVNAPRIHHQWLPDEIYYEKFALSEDVKKNLIKLGYKIGEQRIIASVQAIMIDRCYIYGATDPRRNGLAAGY